MASKTDECAFRFNVNYSISKHFNFVQMEAFFHIFFFSFSSLNETQT